MDSLIGSEQVTERIAECPSAGIQRRRRKGRHHKVLARFDDDEILAIRASAAAAGLTPGGWTAATGVAAAYGRRPPQRTASRTAVDALDALSEQLARLETRLDGSVELTSLSVEVHTLLRKIDAQAAKIYHGGGS